MLLDPAAAMNQMLVLKCLLNVGTSTLYVHLYDLCTLCIVHTLCTSVLSVTCIPCVPSEFDHVLSSLIQFDPV